MYVVITPVTVGLGLAMILATIQTWRELDIVLERSRESLLSWKGFVLSP
jgi:hypothetical protein